MTMSKSIPARLALLATQSETSPALINSQGTIWTRAQLQHQMSALVALFMDAGIQPGDRIATAAIGGITAAWAFLGTACYATAVPLNVRLGKHDLDCVFADLKPAALLTNLDVDNSVSVAAVKFGVRVLKLPDLAISASTDHENRWTPHASPADTALVLHTSGTTSAPKRVALTHTHLLASVENIRAAIDLQPEDRCLNPMPLFHSHGLVAGLLAPLLTGGSVVLPDAFTASEFLGLLAHLRPTWYTAVPAMHQAIVHAFENRRDQAVDHALRLIRSASAPLPPSVMEQLERHFKVPVIETYGMTEATNQITSNLLPPRVRKQGSAGTPIGMELKIIDSHGCSQLPNVTGEVAIRGDSVVAEYENDPEATANAFSDGWLRTGDTGYVDADGYVYLVGRGKELINRGGEKISPRAVEAALLKHPAVAETTAFAVPHPTLGEDLAAVVVLCPGSTESEQAFRLHLFDHVADHMVPSRILILDALPKGPTHKPVRIGLAELLQDQLTTDYTPPATPFECKLAEIWSNVLDTTGVGREDDFFLVGGDSLSAIRVISRVRRAFGIDASLEELSQLPVLKDQAALLLRHALDGTLRSSS